MNKFRKIVSIIVCTLLIFERSVVFSYAQEASPDPSSTPVPTEESTEFTADNSGEVTNNIDSNSESGDNTIELVSPSPSPTPDPSIIPLGLVEETPTATPSETSLVVEESPTPSPTPVSEIETGDSVSITNVENSVNTNVVNSEFVYHTLNIYLDDAVGNIDLNLLAQNALEKVYETDENLGEVVSIKAFSIDNFAYIENNITTTANTGDNQVESSGEGEILTGDAYAATSLLNQVNTNVVDSTIHIVTINIFGSLNGNIILPDSSAISDEACCQATIIVENSGVVVNNISGDANSGQNQIVSSGEDAEIETGNAKTAVNVYNLVNTNLVNSYFNYFEINNLGDWAGTFLGFNENQNVSGGDQGCEGCIDYLALGNTAYVENNVSTSANTGGNSMHSGGGKIRTGNAYSSISIINLINTNIVNSIGFIGFINIFGSLLGNIGGSEKFSAPIIDEEIVQSSQGSDESQKESGGLLEVTHSTNVGTHVLPGDTITFFAKAKNLGTGTVYSAVLDIELFLDGESYGGAQFKLGDIKAQKSVKLTTGLVLSENAVGGEYTAVVRVRGNVGPDNHEVSAFSESNFLILGNNLVLASTVSASEIPPVQPEVLGETLTGGANNMNTWLQLYLYLLSFYVIAKAYQRRELIVPVARKVGAFALHLFTL